MFATGGDDGTIRLWPIADIDPTDDDGSSGGAAAKEKGAASAEPCVLLEHTDRVTGLLCYGATLGSVSWDLSMRLWDINSCLKDDESKSTHVLENAHDDYILSAAYSPELHQMATASADQGVKLWDLSEDVEPDPGGYAAGETCIPEGRKGKLCCGALRGHAADVSHIKWNPTHRVWVSGSEDHSVRLWSAGGVQLHEIHPPGDAITALAVDALGFILVASMDRAVRVYDIVVSTRVREPASKPPAAAGSPAYAIERRASLADKEAEEAEAEAEPPPAEVEYVYDHALMQQHVGHSDAVRCIIHVPEKQQYLTASWDRTIRVWRAYQPDGTRQAHADNAEEGAVEGEGETVEADEYVPYAELHPLVEPKWIADRGKGGGQDKFLKGVAKEDAKGGGRKKKSSEEEMAMKSVTGLSLRLNEFEKELFKNYQFEEKPASNQADRRADRNSKGRGGAADRRGKEATASFRPGLKKA